MNIDQKIFIIGAGISGLSTAYYLTEKGYNNIEIFESSKFTGGRCRSFYSKKLDCDIDNGNHLILNANKNLLGIINKLGKNSAFYKSERADFEIFDYKSDKLKTINNSLPKASINEYIKLVKNIALKKNAEDLTVERVFQDSPNLYKDFFDLVSRSILNTKSESADFKYLQNVFKIAVKSSFPKIFSGLGYLTPKSNWGDGLIKPLTQLLENRGVKIHYGKALKDFKRDDRGRLIKNIKIGDEILECKDNILICALSGNIASKIFKIETPKKYNAIMNIHFRKDIKIENSIIGVNSNLIDWIFIKDNAISTTTSDYKNEGKNQDEIIDESYKIIKSALAKKGYRLDDKVPNAQIIVEKKATFSCSIGEIEKRPQTKSYEYKNLYFCGDYISNGLPSTLEGCLINSKKLSDILDKV
jgi:hypothetical protein